MNCPHAVHEAIRSSTFSTMNIVLTPRVLLLAALGIASLQSQGASVFGRAVQKDGSNPTGQCRATLRAEVERRGAPDPESESAPDGKTSFSAPLDQRGYFQFVGVSPGKHVLAVECSEASAVRELHVQAGTETRINPPMLLDDLTLAVAITPTVDPEGQPWQLTVDATTPRLRSIANKVTTSDGRWARRGLVAGNYRVNISSADGTPWMQRFFNLSTNSGQILLNLPFMQMEGQVRLSSQPVHARLTFHNEAGGEPMTLTSDDGGFFRGLLPVTPGVRETKWTVEVRGIQPLINRRLSGISAQLLGEGSGWLDLALPAFAVHGTVASEKGQLQSGVEVTFEDASNGTRTSTATSESGGFEMSDLQPGKYTVVAESLDGISERTPLQVVQGAESELKLVLKPSEIVSFSVVSNRGPVTGATVQVWIAPGVPRYFTRTDPSGRFEVKVPPGTTEVGLTVNARGYAVKLTRLKISNDSDTDANTITLDDSGGTLMLDLNPGGGVRDGSTTPYLVHDKAIEAVGTLANSDGDQADASDDRPMVVKAIEPGNYSLCLVTDSAQLTALWLGALPSDRCRTGSLDTGGTLTMSPR
jgi:hypothetical protein